MTLTLELPSQLESRLAELAAADGATVEAVALKVLSVGVLMDAPTQSTLASQWSEAAERLAPLYEQSLREGGELTALATTTADVHEYSTAELAQMEGGEFSLPSQRRAA